MHWIIKLASVGSWSWPHQVSEAGNARLGLGLRLPVLLGHAGFVNAGEIGAGEVDVVASKHDAARRNWDHLTVVSFADPHEWVPGARNQDYNSAAESGDGMHAMHALHTVTVKHCPDWHVLPCSG